MHRHFENHKFTSAGFLRAAVLGVNAGVMSMASGEHVSVISQADTNAADIKKEVFEFLRIT